jgi:hypothetical protein
MISLVTANFGGIDDVKELPKSNIQSFLYTDQKDKTDSWNHVINPDFPRHDFSSRLRGRYFKHQIHRLDEIKDSRWLVWADSNVDFFDMSFIEETAELLSKRSENQRAAVLAHPWRKTVRNEADYILNSIENGNEYLRIRYENEKISEQIKYFESKGWDLDSPLWCGTVWMIENNNLMHRTLDSWWDQNLRFGMMDQLSFSVIMKDHGITPYVWTLNLTDNDFFNWGGHRVDLM